VEEIKMAYNNMVAMILAGGRGSRLESLTQKVAKPAVHYGGKYRIIDFPLSNCANSNISIVGVLTQYESVLLNSYVSRDHHWGLDGKDGGIFVLPPRERDQLGLGVYRGTADAITQNIDFLDQEKAEVVLVLSGDHIYKMNYETMLKEHIKSKADATIAVLEVSIKEASRFGVMNVDDNDVIYEFEEKPEKPKSNLVSMGIYMFNYKTLRKYLIEDGKNDESSHDFGHDLIPTYLNDGKKLQAYRFKGYWKDVGTIESLWEANMDLLDEDSGIDLFDPSWKIYSNDKNAFPQYIGDKAVVNNSSITQGCIVEGEVENSVLFTNAIIEEGAIVNNSVVMGAAIVEKGAELNRCIVKEKVIIPAGMKFGSENSDEIMLVTETEVNARKAGK
jgi:glucose-1-phosphate adenylyltransferase